MAGTTKQIQRFGTYFSISTHNVINDERKLLPPIPMSKAYIFLKNQAK
jgi:hypothetical protein